MKTLIGMLPTMLPATEALTAKVLDKYQRAVLVLGGSASEEELRHTERILSFADKWGAAAEGSQNYAHQIGVLSSWTPSLFDALDVPKIRPLLAIPPNLFEAKTTIQFEITNFAMDVARFRQLIERQHAGLPVPTELRCSGLVLALALEGFHA